MNDDANATVRKDAHLGIYFGYPEEDYHADIALGSSDIKRLSYSPESFWWESRMNPKRKEREDTPALIYGRAVHKLTLEGQDAFAKLFAAKELSWATTAGKDEKARFARLGLTPIPREDFDRVMMTGAIVRSNPFIAEALAGGVGTEVSIFWKSRGIKKKARIDRLKVRASIDIKNVANERSISFPRACLRKIDEFDWHIQAEHYREGRLAMRALHASGSVFGNHDMTMLKRIVESTEFAWVWIFVQSSGAPLTWATQLTYQAAKQIVDGETGEVMTDTPEEINPLYAIARARIDRAERNYMEYMKRFGADGTPWVTPEPIGELAPEDLPPWFGREDPI